MNEKTIAKNSFLVLFVAAFILAGTSSGALAAHDTTVTIAPDLANCGEISNTYTVTVLNLGGSMDNVREVRIYEDVDGDGYTDTGIVEFNCGAAPAGWTLDDRTELYKYCQYETTVFGGYMIVPGATEIFTFSATLDDTNEICGNTFKVATIDDKIPVGEVVFKFPFVDVDCNDPVLVKSLSGGNYYGVCPPALQSSGEECWIQQETCIDFTVTDNDEENCDMGLDFCEYSYTVDGVDHVGIIPVYPDPDEFGTATAHICFDEDSVHILDITCYDIAGNMINDVETFRVDSTPPVTTKTYIPDEFIDPDTGYEYIDTIHKAVLTAVDPDPTTFGCNSGVDVTEYRISGSLADKFCENCASWMTSLRPAMGDWNEYTEQFGIPDESCHVIEYRSVDELGNEEEIKWQCVFVDKTPPEVFKDNGEAIEDSGEIAFTNEGNPHGVFHWITTGMPIEFDCVDPLPHPAAGEELCFKVSFDYVEVEQGIYDWGYITDSYCDTPLENGYCCVDVSEEAKYNFYFGEESMHNLEYFCRDAVGKESDVHKQYYKVDDTAPYLVDKWIEGPFYAVEGVCPPTSEFDICHLDGVSHIFIEVVDGGDICAVDDVVCEWKYRLDEGLGYGPYTEWFTYYHGCGGIYFPEESKHELVIRCTDLLGNYFEDVEVFYVDHTPPETTLHYSETPLSFGGDAKWIDENTEVSFTATDTIGPHDSGVDYTKYRVTIVPDYACEFDGECQGETGTGDFMDYLVPFTMTESCHLIEYYSVDNVEKTETVKKECVFVDTTTPTIEKDNGEVIDDDGEPAFTNEGNPSGDFHWITQYMPITFMCEDLGPHPVDHEEFCFKVSYDYVEVEPGIYGWGYNTASYCEGDLTDDGYCCMPMNVPSCAAEEIEICGDLPRTYTFYFEEDSMHNLEYYCEDALGHCTGEHVQYYKVDSEAPTITKVLNGPYYGDCPPEEGVVPLGGDDECFVDTATFITVTTVDNGAICAIDGVECEWRYRVWTGLPIVLDIGPTEWSEWSTVFPITFPEESYHELEIVCVDDLGNSVTDVEWFSVDKTPPRIEKYYGEPSIGDHPTWISSDTPVFVDVYDDGPHKSGLKEVKYRVTLLDNNEYCEYNGPTIDGAQVATVYNCEDAWGSGDWMYMDAEDMESFDFKIPEDSCHLIEIVAHDNVEKASTHKQCVFVDNQGPTPEKTVGQPRTVWKPTAEEVFFYPEIVDKCWSEDETKFIECWKVTMQTPITMDCVDKQPHPVGEDLVCFRVELDGDDATEDYCDNYYNEGAVYDMNDDGYCCLVGPVDFNFGEETEHNLDYYCVDLLGNEGEHDDEKFKVEGTVFEVPLYKKWNLISVPFVLLNSAPEEVFSDTPGVESVWAYDSEEDEWLVYSSGPAPNTLNTIEPGWGYWVMEKEDSEMLRLGGSLFNTKTVPSSRNLVKGWNLIGYYGTSWELYPWGDANFMCGDAFEFPDRYIYGDNAYCSLGSLVDTQEGYPKW
ncbi:MAG: hypothetical protein KAS32_16420, partial [Candidatus Peribacteraceae bacterium]|nr:hypothetical protein [Candidatus Peribacteraceae bacterium]